MRRPRPASQAFAGQVGADAPPAPGDEALIERAATTLALGRLLDHQQESLERQAHRTILSAFLGNGYGDEAEAAMRTHLSHVADALRSAEA